MPVTFSISTHWNAFRHDSGETLIREIIEQTGLADVELGYDLRLDLVEGVSAMVKAGLVRVHSLHNYCPVPLGAPRGHPELFLLASSDARSRELAVVHTKKTISFAASLGARVVVCHGGYVDMRSLTPKLIELCVNGAQYSPKYERLRNKILLKREAKAARAVDYLRAGIEKLMPTLEEHQVAIAFENLPSWEAVPSEMEIEVLCKEFNSPYLRYWHDIGHGQIRENLGFINQKFWLRKLAPWLGGMHVHDVIPPARDHVMPPHGTINFASYADVIPADLLAVLEPATGTPDLEVRDGLDVLRTAWGPSA